MWKPYPWPFGTIGCHCMVMFSEAAAYVSIFTMIAFTFERFTAVCYPLRPSLHSDVKRTRYIIVAIWLVAIFPSSQWTNYIHLHYLTFNNGAFDIPESGVCGIVRDEINFMAAVLSISTTLFLFLIPAIVFPIVYIK